MLCHVDLCFFVLSHHLWVSLTSLRNLIKVSLRGSGTQIFWTIIHGISNFPIPRNVMAYFRRSGVQSLWSSIHGISDFPSTKCDGNYFRGSGVQSLGTSIHVISNLLSEIWWKLFQRLRRQSLWTSIHGISTLPTNKCDGSYFSGSGVQSLGTNIHGISDFPPRNVMKTISGAQVRRVSKLVFMWFLISSPRNMMETISEAQAPESLN